MDYFSMAAHIWYLLRPDSEGATLMKKVRHFFRDVMAELSNVDPIAFLNRYVSEHKASFDAAMNGHPDPTALRCYFTLFRALDVLCETREWRLRATHGRAPLNKQYQNEVELYLTFSDDVHRTGNANDDCGLLFSNLLFFLKSSEMFRRCKVKNFYFRAEEWGDLPFRIGFVPYPAEAEIGFQVEGEKIFALPRPPTEADELFYRRFEYAVTQGNCDVVFGPEMCGSPELDRKLADLCGKDGAAIILCPSYHDQDVSGEIFNRSTVYAYTMAHRRMDRYIKYFPAKTGELTENLSESSEFTIFVFHIENFGRIGFFVCRDYLASNARQIVSMFNFDLVLVSSYTDKTSDFLTEMMTDGGKKRTIILGNACNGQKVENGQKVIPVQYVCYDKNHGPREVKCHIQGKECDQSRCKEMCVRIFRADSAEHIELLQNGESAEV